MSKKPRRRPASILADSKRGRPPAAAKVVTALEEAGMPDAARLAAEAAGLPTRPLTPEEDFLLSVRELSSYGAQPVGFNLESAEQADERAALVATLPAPKPGMRYFVTRGRGPNGDGSRLEVSVRGV